MKQGITTILNENSHGIRMVKTDLKKRSRVDVVNKYGKTLMTYRFNNIPLYEHPYLSWKNLDCCNGWMHDNDYLLTAVQEGKKLVASIYISGTDIDEIQERLKNLESNADEAKEHFEIEEKHINGATMYVGIIIARKGMLAEYFDIDEVADVYKSHGVTINKRKLEEYFNIELIDLFARHSKGFDYANPGTDTELIVCGFGLGYPIESTAYLINRRGKAT